MPNVTLAVPEELHKKMKQHADIRWSEVARRAMDDYLKKIELLDKLTKNSKLTEEDVKEIDKSIKREIAKKYGL